MVDDNSDGFFSEVSTGQLIIAGLVITALLILGIKFITMEDETSSVAPAAVNEGKIFQEKAWSPPPPGYNPASRPAAAGGDSLEIFSRTNPVYADQGTSQPASGAAPAAVAQQAGAAKRARGAAAKKRPVTVIPKMQAAKTFGTPINQGAPSGAVMPDISNLLNQMQKPPGSK